jgi:glutaredoxin
MKKIEIYGQPGCLFCAKAVRYLQAFDLAVLYRDITDPQSRNEMLARNPAAKTVPQIFIGARLIGGHDDLIAIPLNKLQQMIGE